MRERIEPVIPLESIREGRNGLPEILAWQSEPELNVLCNLVGALKLRGVEIATWQAIDLPRSGATPAAKRTSAHTTSSRRSLRVGWPCQYQAAGEDGRER